MASSMLMIFVLGAVIVAVVALALVWIFARRRPEQRGFEAQPPPRQQRTTDN